MAQLIGQRGAETLLARALLHGKVSHAYLFLGPSHAGKSTAAYLFTQAINCARQPAVTRDEGGRMKDENAGSETLHPSSLILHPLRLSPCGQCESCRRIAAGTHPEVKEVRPGSKTGQNISVAQAREIRRDAALRPKLGERRVYIIPNAEAFNEESANALLKTLEEPSPFVTLILCAPSPSLVLPTIRSRCQTVRFGLAPPQEVVEALVAAGTPPDTASAVAFAAGGRPGLAFTWASEPAVLERRRVILDLFGRAVCARSAARRDPSAGVFALRLAELFTALGAAEKAEKDDGDEPKRPAKALHIANLETGLSCLRDLLLLTGGAGAGLVQNQDRLSEFIEMVPDLRRDELVDAIESVREAQQLLERNVTPALALERMFWALIAGRLPIQERLFETVAV